MRPLAPLAVLLSLALAPAAHANARAIAECQAAVEARTGQRPNEFDATYRQRLLQPDTVRWPGIECEVMDGKVKNLKIDGAAVIVSGWPSPEAKRTYDQLAAETNDAVRLLETRRDLLRQRLAEAEARLKARGSNPDEVAAFVRDGITQAVGK
jgi:hypothetical protein